MAPVVHALRRQQELRVRLLCSGQHREMLAPLLQWFELAVDDNLDVMIENQTLGDLTGRLMHSFQAYLSTARPDLVIGQGDTTTVMCAALVCFYHRIAFAHVEAGLRTHDLQNPFPEEFNRLTVGHLARHHFCPTRRAAQNILAEGARPESVHITGNTVIDALYFTTAKLGAGRTKAARAQILLTAHRRENFGRPMENIFRAVLKLCSEFPEITVLYPVHPNPNVKDPAYRLLAGHPQITLTAPLSYPHLVDAMQNSLFILTDSGGIQEEAPALGKPVIVLRQQTERPEAVELGVARLAGTDEGAILEECRKLLWDSDHFRKMSSGGSPYGDGHAADRIRKIVAGIF